MVKIDSIYDVLKPKSLQFYIQNNNATGNIQKYRKVFDENEIAYLFVDFIFYNKLFDEEEWQAGFTFNAFKLMGGNKVAITTDTISLNVTSDLSTGIASTSWGQEEKGATWDKGKYLWEVYYKDELLWKDEFYVESFGDVTRDSNPYFDFLNLTVFEAGSKIPPIEDRNYYTRFQSNVTRFVFTEFEFQNLHPGEQWKGEFTFNYYNDVKELIGQVRKIETVTTLNKNNTCTVFGGVGSETEITWQNDIYTVEVIFMGNFIASVQFEVGDTPNKTKLIVDAPKKNNGNSLLYSGNFKKVEKEIFKEIDSLIGLSGIKKKLHEYYYYVKYLKLRNEKGIKSEEKINLNFVFTGNPGTGKTTVAKLLGRIFKELGLLKKNMVYEVDRGDLVGRYVGETAPQTKEVINKARGGILFIDEAYALWRGAEDTKDFGREAIEVLVKELSDGPGNIAVIVAGYPKEMKGFLESNPGLKSRFNVWYEFPDYLPEELLSIAKLNAKKKSLAISAAAEKPLHKIIVDAYRKRDRTFGNARFVTTIIDQSQMNLGLRVMRCGDMKSLTRSDISTIQKVDIDALIANMEKVYPDFPIDEALLKKSLNELNELTGLEKVKTEVREMVKLVRFYKESKKDVLNSFSLHNVFIGNPGTGKTTVARIMANIYKALGLLERGHLVECGKDTLVAGFVGQTAIKTSEKINDALGGVLFIDEAYALSSSSSGDFGAEAIEVILKAMEDNRGKFSLITAGYVDEMNDFLDSNPGLKSRFDNFIYFDDYTVDELFEIAKGMFSSKNVKLANEAEDELKQIIEFRFKRKDKFFGNARFIRRLTDRIIHNQNLRLSDLPKKDRTTESLSLIVEDDIASLVIDEEFYPAKKRKFGF
jgi:SpoVK/Ycf46/Vps4 family AAA+-type ATPase